MWLVRQRDSALSQTYISYDPDLQQLLPAAVQKWLPPAHLAYFISDIADHLDRSAITARPSAQQT